MFWIFFVEFVLGKENVEFVEFVIGKENVEEIEEFCVSMHFNAIFLNI